MSRGSQVAANVLYLALGLGALLGALLIFTSAGNAPKKKGKKRGGFRFNVRTQPVHKGRMNVSLRLTGEVVPRRTVLVRSEVSSVVRLIRAREGTSLQRGKLMVALQNIDQRLALRKQAALLQAAKASLLVAKATLGRERDLLRRIKQLRRRKMASESAFIQAKYSHAAAKASIAQREADIALRRAELSIAKRELSRTLIRAPFPGTITKLHVELGKWVNKGDPVAEIVGVKRAEARLFVPPRLLAKVKVGMSVSLSVRGAKDTATKAKINRLLPTADANSRNRIAVVELSSPPAAFLPGLPVEARVIIDQRDDSLVVSKDALIRFGGGWVVYKVVGGKAKMVRIKVANEDAGKVQIRGPVAEGDAIVVVGNEALFPNAPVRDGSSKKPRGLTQ